MVAGAGLAVEPVVPGRMKASRDPWLRWEEDIRWLVTEVVMGGYAGSAITEGGRGGWGSKTELERVNFPANGAVGWLSGIVLRLFLALSMVGEDCCGRKSWGGFGRE